MQVGPFKAYCLPIQMLVACYLGRNHLGKELLTTLETLLSWCVLRLFHGLPALYISDMHSIMCLAVNNPMLLQHAVVSYYLCMYVFSLLICLVDEEYL